MLYLTRKIGESIIINDNVKVTVVEVRGKSIKLGFTFPAEVSVLREELYARIQQENRDAAESATASLDDLSRATGPRTESSADTAMTGAPADETDRGS
ncbi:MAG: carbon storage regulator CsrA [Inquilinaceae bacterium]